MNGLAKRIFEWDQSIVPCYEQQLSDEERQALHRWESSSAFTSTDRWPGWIPHLGRRPGRAIAQPPIPIRRSA
jgi:hypothetical protein